MLPDPNSSFSSSHARQPHPYSHHNGQGWLRPGRDLIRGDSWCSLFYHLQRSTVFLFILSWPSLHPHVAWQGLLVGTALPNPLTLGEPYSSGALISFMSSLSVPHYPLYLDNYKLASRTCVSPEMQTGLLLGFSIQYRWHLNFTCPK